MITIRATTKKGQDFLDAYRRSRNTRLSDCYGRYSTDKARADRECREKMIKTGGEGYRILSYNQNVFTCGWRTTDGNLQVETHCNTYLVTEAAL